MGKMSGITNSLSSSQDTNVRGAGRNSGNAASYPTAARW
jgi:hypothetical protein